MYPKARGGHTPSPPPMDTYVYRHMYAPWIKAKNTAINVPSLRARVLQKEIGIGNNCLF